MWCPIIRLLSLGTKAQRVIDGGEPLAPRLEVVIGVRSLARNRQPGQRIRRYRDLAILFARFCLYRATLRNGGTQNDDIALEPLSFLGT